MNRPIIIGTRGSDLALWQANYVKAQLGQAFPEDVFEIRIISTTGDEVLDVALSKIGDKGLFTRQIETELIEGRIDLAVHSLKDLQTEQPAGLSIGAVCEREISRDVLISRGAGSIDELPAGARVATGSLRRRSQLLAYKPDLVVEEIRGNVPTRLRKFDESTLDAMILAYAGLHRLGFADRITQIIPTDIMLPAVGQGAVAIEVRDGNDEVNAMVSKLDHPATRTCIRAERAFLKRLEGGCQVPIGASAALADGRLTLAGFVGSLDGKTFFRRELTQDDGTPEELGTGLAEILIDQGARAILDDARAEAAAAESAI